MFRNEHLSFEPIPLLTLQIIIDWSFKGDKNSFVFSLSSSVLYSAKSTKFLRFKILSGNVEIGHPDKVSLLSDFRLPISSGIDVMFGELMDRLFKLGRSHN